MVKYKEFLDVWNSWAIDARERGVPEDVITRSQVWANRIRWEFTQYHGFDSIEEAGDSGELSNEDELGPRAEEIYQLFLKALALYP